MAESLAGSLGAGWLFVGAVAVLTAGYCALGTLHGCLRRRAGLEALPHAEFWAELAALEWDGVNFALGAIGFARYDDLGGAPVPRAHRHSGYGAVASADVGHGGAHRRRSDHSHRAAKERKKERKRRHGSLPSNSLGGKREGKSGRRRGSDHHTRVAALFDSAGVGVHHGRQPRLGQPAATRSSSGSSGAASGHSARSAPARPTSASALPAAPAAAAAPPPPERRRRASLEETAAPRRFAPTALPPAPAPAAAPATLKPAALTLAAPSAQHAPALASFSPLDDEITPRTRRIGAFAARSANAGGFAAGASAACAPIPSRPSLNKKATQSSYN